MAQTWAVAATAADMLELGTLGIEGSAAVGQHWSMLDQTTNAFSGAFGQLNGEGVQAGSPGVTAAAANHDNAFGSAWHDVMSGTTQHDNAFAAAFHDSAAGTTHSTGTGSESSHNAFAATFGGGAHGDGGNHGSQGGHEAGHSHDASHSHDSGGTHDGGGSHGGGGSDPGS